MNASGPTMAPIVIGSAGSSTWRGSNAGRKASTCSCEGSSTRYRAGPIDLVMEAQQDSRSPDLFQPRLTIEYPGYAPITLEGSATSATMAH